MGKLCLIGVLASKNAGCLCFPKIVESGWFLVNPSIMMAGAVEFLLGPVPTGRREGAVRVCVLNFMICIPDRKLPNCDRHSGPHSVSI